MNRVFVTPCVYPLTKKNKGTALFQAKKRIHTQQGCRYRDAARFVHTWTLDSPPPYRYPNLPVIIIKNLFI